MKSYALQILEVKNSCEERLSKLVDYLLFKFQEKVGMKISERLLLSLSRPTVAGGKYQRDKDINAVNALDLLKREFPDFENLVTGKRVADFGCGEGWQSIALVKDYYCSVVGVDTNQRALTLSNQNASNYLESKENLSFVKYIAAEMLSSFDVVISQNSFEHFSDPEDVLKKMTSLLTESGVILITFGPPWLSPYGSHMHFFCKLPWINVLFPEETVMKVRGHYRADGAQKYEDVESGLNRMTIARFEALISLCNLNIVYKKYKCIKGLDWAAKIPVIREFFINRVSVILSADK